MNSFVLQNVFSHPTASTNLLANYLNLLSETSNLEIILVVPTFINKLSQFQVIVT
jgi:hypothetical protein